MSHRCGKKGKTLRLAVKEAISGLKLSRVEWTEVLPGSWIALVQSVTLKVSSNVSRKQRKLQN